MITQQWLIVHPVGCGRILDLVFWSTERGNRILDTIAKNGLFLLKRTPSLTLCTSMQPSRQQPLLSTRSTSKNHRNRNANTDEPEQGRLRGMADALGLLGRSDTWRGDRLRHAAQPEREERKGEAALSASHRPREHGHHEQHQVHHLAAHQRRCLRVSQLGPAESSTRVRTCSLRPTAHATLSVCGTERHNHLNRHVTVLACHLGEEDNGDGVEADAQHITALD
jgi:hypothetical protein